MKCIRALSDCKKHGNWVLGKCEDFVEKEDWKTLKILNVKTEDFQILKSEDLVTKPAKPEEWRFEFLTGKIQLLIQALLTEKTAPGDTSPSIFC